MYTYSATLLEVHDGDTVTVDLDLGFDLRQKHRLRLAGIDAPELSTAAGVKARDYLRKLLKPGDRLIVHTLKNRAGREKTEKYGRYLAEIHRREDEQSLNRHLLATGHVRPWSE